MERIKRIALYGGTFDPVHVGHIAVAENLLTLFALDELIFVPAHVAPHKRGRDMTPAMHRYAMLALATQHHDGLRVSSAEIDEPQRPYTVDTLSRFKTALGASTRLFFVMGADSWEEITTWREWERVLTSVDHIVVTRPGCELSTGHVTGDVRNRIIDVRGAGGGAIESALDEGTGTKIFLTDIVQIDVSSTSIRRAVSEGRGGILAKAVAPSVAGYITKYKLYKEAHERKLSNAGQGDGEH